MSLRITACCAAVLCLVGPGPGPVPGPVVGPAMARGATVQTVASGRDRDAALSPARERQKSCGTEWRGLSTTEKTAKGPTWPQFYSKCVKRLKQPKA